MPRILATLTLACLLNISGFLMRANAQSSMAPSFHDQIAPIFEKYCVGCHNQQDREGGLSLESFAALAEGGDSGPAIVPGDAAGSRLWKLVALGIEPKMPPEDQAGPNTEELETLQLWIKAGAPGPEGDSPRPRRLTVPQVAVQGEVASPITAAAWNVEGNRLALASYARVELLNAETSQNVATIDALPGKINSVSFSTDGQWLLTASGITGLNGQADLWQAADGSHVKSFQGHRDTMLAAALSPDGQRLATASYDRSILIWNVQTGEVERELRGHNGAIYSLQFDPSSTLLVSASADQTLKLWNAATGERLDTLGQPLKEQFCALFSADAQAVFGAGADNRIRRWRLISRNNPAINPLEVARFAHEGPIVALASSADGRFLASSAEDKTVKFWRASDLVELAFRSNQSDIVSAISFSPDGTRALLARLDGTWDIIPFPTEKHEVQTVEEGLATSELPMDAGPTEITELEPNNSSAEGQPIALPAIISGIIQPSAAETDEDWYRFESRAGQSWMIEVDAARSGSPLDSIIEVRDAQGAPVPRVLLQAVRDSYFTFRGKDSSTSDDFRVHNWEEMELNEFLYSDGEVVRLWLYPRGPDSGFKVYPGVGARYTYFDTTPITHALGAPCYIVKPHPVGTRLIPNGLPTFKLNFENDDNSRRRWGRDSRLNFVAPSDGIYHVRIRDVRGFGGEDYRYRMTIRPAQPDFQASLGGRDPQVAPGSGREFSITVVRTDDFEGPIEVSIDGLPPGFHATTPIVIEAGQDSAVGVLWADLDAVAPTAEQNAQVTVVARGEASGRKLEHALGDLGNIQLAPAGQVRLRVAPASGELSSVDATLSAAGATQTPWPGEEIFELTIHPGQTITATVLVQRNEFNGGVALGNDDSGRNLPHGAYVDNIGLNGLLVIENQNERVFFITASPIAAYQERWFFLKARIGGEPCSLPVKLKVIPRPEADASAATTP